jgi:MFS family permease
VVEAPARGSLWRQPSFISLWSSETISSFGAQFSELAIPLTAVLALQGTPAELGILNAAVTVPFLIFSLLAGVWVDRHRRRSVMILSNVGRALLLAIIPITAATRILTIPLLLGVAFLVGSLRVFFDIAYQSFLPELVQREQLVDANSRLEASRSVSSVAGPGIAGFVIQAITAPLAIAFDAVSFVFSTLFLSGIRTQEAKFDNTERPSVLSEIREGIQVVFNDARLRSLAGTAATANFFEFAIQALFLLYAVNALALQPSELGLILGAGAVGAVVGALVAGKLSEWMGVGPAMIVSMIIGASIWAPMIYFASRPTAIPFLIVAWFFGEVSFVSWSINQSSFRQAICSTGMQGRVNATMRFLTVGVVPVGSIVGGALGEIVGLHAAIGVASIGLVLAPLWILVSPIRKVKNVLDEKTVG